MCAMCVTIVVTTSAILERLRWDSELPVFFNLHSLITVNVYICVIKLTFSVESAEIWTHVLIENSEMEENLMNHSNF